MNGKNTHIIYYPPYNIIISLRIQLHSMTTPVLTNEQNGLLAPPRPRARQGSRRKSSVSAETLLDFLVHQSKIEKEKELKNSNKQHKNPAQLSIVEILQLSDEKLCDLFKEDLFFKAKVDLKIKKYLNEIQSGTHVSQPSPEQKQEEEQGNFITLSILRKKEKQNLKKFYEKYLRITQDQTKCEQGIKTSKSY